MSNIKVSYTGDGVTVLYTIPFQYLNRDHVKVSVNGSGASAFTFANDTTIQFNTAPANGADIVLERETTADAAENTFFPNSSIRSSALNDNFLQTLYVSEEAREIAADAQFGNIVPGSIGTATLADGAVTNAKVSNTADIAPSKISGTAVITTDARLSDERIPTDGSVTNAKVSNSAAIAYSKLNLTGSLVDADVNASAAIAGTKISPDFGSQNVVTTGDVQAQDVVASGDVQTGSINGGPLAGFRNLLINGNPTINQRAYVSGTNTTGANEYTLDRWRVVTSGQNITFTDSAGVRTVTAPAGGVEQVIEGGSIIGGTYTLSWTGTATATVNSVACLNGGSVTLTGGADATVRFSGGTVSLAQLEAGTTATPFELRPIGVELALCQRYFWQIGSGSADSISTGSAVSINQTRVPIVFPVQMRTVPTFSSASNAVLQTYGSTAYTSTSVAYAGPSTYGGHLIAGVTPTTLSAREAGIAQVNINKTLEFDAEL